MTTSPTAKFLNDAITASPLTQREIAHRAGFPHPNILSMFKSGETKVPLDRIPALANVLGVNQFSFLFIALEEYFPEVFWTLEAAFGLPLMEDEVKLLGVYRRVGLGGDLVMDDVLCAAIEAVLELECDRRE